MIITSSPLTNIIIQFAKQQISVKVSQIRQTFNLSDMNTPTKYSFAHCITALVFLQARVLDAATVRNPVHLINNGYEHLLIAINSRIQQDEILLERIKVRLF